MIFTETEIPGAFVVDLKQLTDERGFFARQFCAKEFEDAGIRPEVVQCNVSFNHKAGTLRGMHMQDETAPESKFVRCVRGTIYDVIVDLRPGSETYGRHIGVELSADNRRGLYVPPLFAHGYLTLTDDTEVLYQVGGYYTPSAERGFRYNDPSFNISWPREAEVISDKDAAWPLRETS